MTMQAPVTRSVGPARVGRSCLPFGTRPPRSARLATFASADAPNSTSTPAVTKVSTPMPAGLARRELLLSAAASAAAALAAPALILAPALAPAPAAAKPGASSSSDPGDWSSPGLGTPVDPNAPKFVKLPSGVRFQELNLGSGTAAGSGDVVLFDYVLRRSNGYFIYGTIEGISFQPRDVPTSPVNAKLGVGELIPGLEEVLAGMAPGSKRRALIPPELGYVGGSEGPQPPTFATKRQLETHRGEPLLFEVQMLRVGGKK